jgi:RHH-type proline utilization regulon transcriptional repressor/proline dehydrogenase/delta 1-pyrroline-5-carboxylate dehydrogenase
LPEQVVRDVVMSAFNSAGQRCSALRVLCVQEEIADRVLALIQGSMRELVVGDPARIETDVGPVISARAKADIDAHIAAAELDGRVLYRLPLNKGCSQGHFVAPTLIRLDRFDQLDREVFGPVLHILRFDADGLLDLCDAINASGFSLTFGLHSRISHRIETVCRRIRAGNIYVNRNMIGAVVGSQPFGGNNLSGTGPKAGGPHYLQRFADEQVISNNTAAIGGDPATLAAGE